MEEHKNRSPAAVTNGTPKAAAAAAGGSKAKGGRAGASPQAATPGSASKSKGSARAGRSRAKATHKAAAASAPAATPDTSRAVFSPFVDATSGPAWPFTAGAPIAATAGLTASAQAVSQEQQQELLSEQWLYQQHLLESEHRRQHQQLLLQQQHQQQQMLAMMRGSGSASRSPMAQVPLPARGLNPLANPSRLSSGSGGLIGAGSDGLLPRTISVDAATAAAAQQAAAANPSLAIRPLTLLERSGSLGGAGSLYRSLTAPSMSGYVADLMPNPDLMGMTGDRGQVGRDFFLLPEDYMQDIASELMLEGNSPLAAAAATGAAASAFAQSPKVRQLSIGAAAAAAGVTVGTPRSIATRSSSGSGGRAGALPASAGDLIQSRTPTSAAAHARMAAAAAAAAGGSGSPQVFQHQGATEEQMLFTTWRDVDASQALANPGSPMTRAALAASNPMVLGQLVGGSGSLMFPSGSSAAHSLLLPYNSLSLTGDQQMLFLKGSGNLGTAGGAARVGDALLLPPQYSHRLVSASSAAAALAAASAPAGVQAGLVNPGVQMTGSTANALANDLLLRSAVRRASSNAQAAAAAAAAASLGMTLPPGTAAADGQQLPPVPALRLTPPSLPTAPAAPLTPVPVGSPSAILAAAAVGANMRTISSITNDLTAGVTLATAAPAATTAAGCDAGSPTADIAPTATLTNIDNNILAGSPGAEGSPRLRRDDSMGRVTRARTKANQHSDSTQDEAGGMLQREDSGVSHPKKRARLGVEPAGVVAMEVAAVVAGSKPTGPALGL